MQKQRGCSGWKRYSDPGMHEPRLKQRLDASSRAVHIARAHFSNDLCLILDAINSRRRCTSPFLNEYAHCACLVLQCTIATDTLRKRAEEPLLAANAEILLSCTFGNRLAPVGP